MKGFRRAKMAQVSILIISLLLSYSIAIDDTVVEIESGVEITGFRMTTIKENREFSAFSGIPYTEPPVGHLRFRPPVRKIWRVDSFDATKESPECPQIDLLEGGVYKGQEDCLVLNVYTHSTLKPLRKVMVFFHGGSFRQDSGIKFGPRRLLDRDLVLVTVNSRLGPLGYLSTMDSASPGNYGLLDQTEALRWIQRNIKAFGGDPDKVTIFGVSSGGISVFYHYISPLSHGLFHRAIAQSGDIFTLPPFNPRSRAELLANSVGCLHLVTDKMIECLKDIPVKTLVEATDILDMEGTVAFTPVLDNEVLLFQHGRIANPVPLMFGGTKDEGLLFAFALYLQLPPISTKVLANLLGFTLNREPRTIPIDMIELVRKEYFESVNASNDSAIRKAMVSMITDGLFFAPLIKTAQMLINMKLNPYLYSYDYTGSQSILNLLGINENLGVSHEDDMSFLFDIAWFPAKYNKSNDENEEKFMDIWTNFAEYGIPPENIVNGTENWEPAQSEEINICHLNRDITIDVYQPKTDWRVDFWLRKIPAYFKLPMY